MFMLQVNIVDGSARMIWTPRGQRVPGRPRCRSILTHMPTGRRWEFKSKRAGLAAQRAMSGLVEAGQLSILPLAVEAA